MLFCGAIVCVCQEAIRVSTQVALFHLSQIQSEVRYSGLTLSAYDMLLLTANHKESELAEVITLQWLEKFYRSFTLYREGKIRLYLDGVERQMQWD